jgi:AraC-like DNA-binding protein
LNKPFDWEILLSRIKYLLEQKKDRQQEFFKAVVLSPENITISSPDEKLMKRALEVFEKNMDNSEYSIEEFSRDMGMSRNNLYRKIKAITGESPTDFLNSVRLKQAAVLLKEGHMNVNEIAYAVGFSTHSYFTQSFKKMFGVPPNKYKQ